MFNKDFVWGVAASSYQSEGTDPNDGRGKCIWDSFMEKIKTTDMDEVADASVSCDHMHHYKNDYKLMKNLGIKAYRFSISWSRIMPEGIGRVNEKAIALYRDMILEMKKNGIEPYITLYHWELPQILQDMGGWLNDESSDWFAEYARCVAENFSDICQYFITLNEPQCFVGIGHLSGVHAPGYKLPLKDVFKVAHNALKAHGKAVINLRNYSVREIKIGYAPTCGVAYPYTELKEDIEAARKVYFGFYMPDDNWTWNVSWFSDPVFLGHYPEEGIKRFKEYLPEITNEDMELIHQPLDFMGQNIYNGYYIRAGADGEPEYVNRPNGFPLTAAKWPITPRCLYWGAKFNYERYHMPLYITENGESCHDLISPDGCVHDRNRIDFLDLYISELQKAYDEGVDIRGYFLWTFLDNFEWDKGYSEKFGIVYVDFETQQRVVKDSAFWYKEVIESNGANLLVNKKSKPLIILKNSIDDQSESKLLKNTIESQLESKFLINIDSQVRYGIFKDQSINELVKKEAYLFGKNSAEYEGKFKLYEKFSELINNYGKYNAGLTGCQLPEQSGLKLLYLNDNYKIWEFNNTEDCDIIELLPEREVFYTVAVVEGDGIVDSCQLQEGDIFIIPAGREHLIIRAAMKLIIC